MMDWNTPELLIMLGTKLAVMTYNENKRVYFLIQTSSLRYAVFSQQISALVLCSVYRKSRDKFIVQQRYLRYYTVLVITKNTRCQGHQQGGAGTGASASAYSLTFKDLLNQ
jgi:hypothetical protein